MSSAKGRIRAVWSHIVIICVLCMALPNCVNADESSHDPLVWFVTNPDITHKILPTNTRVPGKRNGRIDIVGCRGQFESATVVLVAGPQGLPAIKISAQDLSKHDSKIGGNLFDIKLVKTWYQAESAGKYIKRWNPRTRVLVPELLLKDESLIRVDEERRRNFVRVSVDGRESYVDISADEIVSSEPRELDEKELSIEDSSALKLFDVGPHRSQSIWITVQIPSDASAGLYAGSIRVSVQGVDAAAIPVTLRILPFDLQHSRKEYSIYYRGVLSDKGSISSERKSEVQYRAELRDMKEHGVSNPNVYQPLSDILLLRRALEIRKELGVMDGPLYYLGITTNRTEKGAEGIYRNELRRLRTVTGPLSISDIFVYGIDEAREDVL